MVNRRKLVSSIGCLALLGAATTSAMSVTVTTSAPSPAPVGTKVTFTAVASGTSTDSLWYRFRVKKQGGDYQIIRDFGPSNSLNWTASAHEGAYDMEVSARDLNTGGVGAATTLFLFNPVVTADNAIVSPTNNSLVFLYSAPACTTGQRMSAEFVGPDGIAHQTPYEDCTGQSMNFYLAGMLAHTAYQARHTLDTGSAFLISAEVSFTTLDLPANLYSDTILVPAQNSNTIPVPAATRFPGDARYRGPFAVPVPSAVPVSDGILLGSTLDAPAVAYDLAGNVLWYGPNDISIVTRTEMGGDIWGIVEVTGGVPSQQTVRKFDLTGMTLLETNAARVNEQLKAMGKRQISAFHHEARPLSDGSVAVLGDVEQILTDVQGPGPVDVVGDMIVVLDPDLNVTWTWDTFDNLDVSRMAVLGETCPGACAPTILAPTGNDWTHGNAIQETADGNLLYSSRHQDWLIKVAYNYGDGDGHIIWRMGKDGDFTINSTDPYPWFSHQHDGNFEISDPTKLLVFDDGNTRVVAHGGNSRGQMLQIDEQNRVATLMLNADLGVFSMAVGSAEQLRDGNYHFDAGFVAAANNTQNAYSFEVDGTGKIVYDARANAILYRTFRMTDMYTPN